MSRFEEVTEDVYKIIYDLVGNHFSYLAGAKITVIFDTKKKKKDGRFVLGRIQATNDLTKFLSADTENPDGSDYILYIDKNVWDEIPENDRKRLIYHELCHCEVDLDKKNPFKTRDHEIQGFYSELTYNEDDPKWNERISSIAESVYDNE